jgi:RNA polymerase sigma factor (sigma-70 family)
MATPQLRTLIRRIEKLSGGTREPPVPDCQLLEDFAVRGDGSAFAELVARHGAMVLRVCRGALLHEQDAFQATFLVLARCFGSIRKREALAEWLHGVAYRTAMKAKRSAARRRNHEAQMRERPPANTASPTWDDVQAVLDEEVRRLPESFRSAFVHCVLEHKTIAVTAIELQCKEGTVSSRLARARQRLQKQLARRGINLAALLTALFVARGVARAVPARLSQMVIRNGHLVAAGGTALDGDLRSGETKQVGDVRINKAE